MRRNRALLSFLGGFEEACEPRHLPWRHAHDIINYLSLNFFDAILKDDAAASARLAPGVLAGIESLRDPEPRRQNRPTTRELAHPP